MVDRASQPRNFSTAPRLTSFKLSPLNENDCKNKPHYSETFWPKSDSPIVERGGTSANINHCICIGINLGQLYWINRISHRVELSTQFLS